MDLFEDLVDVPVVVGLWLRPPLLALLAVLGRGGAALVALGRAPAAALLADACVGAALDGGQVLLRLGLGRLRRHLVGST